MDSLNSVEIRLPATSTIRNVEDIFASSEAKECRSAPKLTISFADVEFFDLQSLIFLVAIASGRKRKGKSTGFRLPDEENPQRNKILMLLYEWGFFEVVMNQIGLDVLSLVENPQAFEPVLEVVRFAEKEP